MREVSVRAHAKLNLRLRVLYKRADGFHELRTVFQTISLADELHIRFVPSGKTRITTGSSLPIPDNLVERAAQRVLEETRTAGAVEFLLKKRIPMGAGLGGGSSDAAAVLLALPVLTGKPIAAGRLQTIAAELGSDVPFFLTGGTALGIGKGDELYDLPDYRSGPLALVAPEVHVSTPDAYSDLSGVLDPEAVPAKLLSFQQGEPVNDFEAPVFARHPELERVKNRLIKLGAEPALMTGSGSSIFGVFHSKQTLGRVIQSWNGGKIYPISLLSRARYRSEWLRRLKPHTEGNLWPPRSRYAR